MRSMTKLAAGVASALTLMVALTAPPTSAQQAQGPTGMAACRADIATFCKGIEAGGGKRVQCLQANEAKLQPDCAAAMQTRADAKGPKGAKAASTAPVPAPGALPPDAGQKDVGPKDVGPKAAIPAGGDIRPMVACKSDVKALCGNVPAGGGAKVKCLRENQAKVSPACADALAAKQAERKATQADFRAACKGDGRALCKGTKGPDRRACLVNNLAKLTPACADALGTAAVAPGAQPKVQ